MEGRLMQSLFVRKLSTFSPLSPDSERELERATRDIRAFKSGDVVLRSGDVPQRAHAILEGFACRYKLLPDGKRQILDFLIPGDLCDGHMLFMAEMDHNVAALSACRIAIIPHATLLHLTERRPDVARALWWSALVQESIAREWIVNVGRRFGEQRVGHLLCEICFRLAAVGLVRDREYQLPLTQLDLADATGLSAVHINRVLQRLRADGLIRLRSGKLTVNDLRRLEEFSGFDPAYLHPRAPVRTPRISLSA
jgi:CRP-like cAMP-binding protein